MDMSRSVDFLLDQSGPVIQYRVHTEILQDVNRDEAWRLLERVLDTPAFRQTAAYQKGNGYIGLGMHSWDKFKESPLQDGEAAARLLANYAIPGDMPVVARFAAALRAEDTLKAEFSYYGPEMARFENRHLGINSGSTLMTLVYTCLALLGYGEDTPFPDISYDAFECVLGLTGLMDLAVISPNRKGRYNYPCIRAEDRFPCQYHLETLAHTRRWRTPEKQARLAMAINHLNYIMNDTNELHVQVGARRYSPYWAYVRPMRPFSTCDFMATAQRKMITHLAMAAGKAVDVVRISAENAMEAMGSDGILRLPFASAYQKRCFKNNLGFGPYSEIALETSHKTDTSLWCETTFWAVQLMDILKRDA